MSRIVVITGGGAGVGRPTVVEFAKAGYDVALLSRDRDSLNRMAEKVNAKYGARSLINARDAMPAAREAESSGCRSPASSTARR